MRRFQLIQGACKQQLAVFDDADLIAQLFRNLQHMGAEEDRLSFVGMLAHHLFQLKRGLRIKAGHGFIKDPDGRVVNQRSHDHDLLTHAVRIGKNLVVQRIIDAQKRCRQKCEY